MNIEMTLLQTSFSPFDVQVDSILTPKKNLTSLFQDEDSGLGMDEPTEGETTTCGLSPLNFIGQLHFEDSAQKLHIRRPEQQADRKSQRLGSIKRGFDGITNTPKRKNRKTAPSLRKTLSFEVCPHSDQCDNVLTAVNKMAEKEELIGDGSESFCLPTVTGKHQDLKSITADTLADILNSNYDDVINSCRIIDCRYPYEYDGGHIRGAENLYTKERVSNLLNGSKPASADGKRDILVFHCEFSSERGPKMMRFLRAQDRSLNKHHYPSLNYPEVYLLDRGYKAFFEKNGKTNHCEPMAYKPMIHQDNMNELRHFRAKSKSWTAGEKRRNLNFRLRL